MPKYALRSVRVLFVRRFHELIRKDRFVIRFEVVQLVVNDLE